MPHNFLDEMWEVERLRAGQGSFWPNLTGSQDWELTGSMEGRSLKDRSIQARFSGCCSSCEITWLKPLSSLRTLLFSHRDCVSDFPDFECFNGRCPFLGSSLRRSGGTK